jgi:acetoin utilization deacetylase AcuC-like enzyme
VSPVTGFFLHPASPLHDTGWSHPEHQGRLRALASTVGKDLLTLHGHVEQMEPAEATAEDLLRVHGERHVEVVRQACAAAERTGRIGSLDPDTKVSAASWEAAVGSVGTAIAAARAVAEGSIRNAFVATRPPGHHATPDRAMGFCLFGNAAIAGRHAIDVRGLSRIAYVDWDVHHAMGFCLFNNVAAVARWLQAAGHAERVLVLDWDVHHGNGTQDVFWEDPSVFFVSVHQWPHYPGTGSEKERGGGAGEGTTVNVPLPAGTPADVHRESFERAIEEALRGFVPDFVLVSAGFDCMAGDPLGDLLLEPPDLYAMTRFTVETAAARCDGRVVALLEGGYDPKRLGEGAVAVIRALAGLEAPGP